MLGGSLVSLLTIEAKGPFQNWRQNRCAAQVTFAIEISIFLIINIASYLLEEQRQIGLMKNSQRKQTRGRGFDYGSE